MLGFTSHCQMPTRTVRKYALSPPYTKQLSYEQLLLATFSTFDVVGNVVARNRKAVYFWQLVAYKIKGTKVAGSSCATKLLRVWWA